MPFNATTATLHVKHIQNTAVRLSIRVTICVCEGAAALWTEIETAAEMARPMLLPSDAKVLEILRQEHAPQERMIGKLGDLLP